MIDLDNSKNENQKETPSQGDVDKYDIASKIFSSNQDYDNLLIVY